MDKLWALFVIALLANQTFAMNLRHKRQTDDSEDDLEDRYGWDGARQRPWIQGQGQRPGQRQRPGQGQDQFPGQGQFQGQGQGQFQGQGQGQFQGQGQGQFPGQGQFQGQGQGPFQGQGQQQQQSTTPSPAIGTTTVAASIQECMRTCPVTAEYNPVCGTDNVTYTNPGRLGCAQSCGLNINLLRTSPCPTTTPATPV